MDEVEKALRRLQRVYVRLREAEARADKLRQELRAELAQARAAGATVSGIARAIGVSRQRVQQLLSRRS